MRKLLLFAFIVLLPAVVVGISNFDVFPDSAWAATIMLVVTVGVAAANAALQNAERRRLAQLPRSERRSSIAAPKAEPTKATTPAPIVAPMAIVPPGATVSASITATPRLTPEQVRESW